MGEGEEEQREAGGKGRGSRQVSSCSVKGWGLEKRGKMELMERRRRRVSGSRDGGGGKGLRLAVEDPSSPSLIQGGMGWGSQEAVSSPGVGVWRCQVVKAGVHDTRRRLTGANPWDSPSPPEPTDLTAFPEATRSNTFHKGCKPKCPRLGVTELC